jgi:ParB family chromosome partitioning protein
MDTLAPDELQLSPSKPPGFIPRPTPSLLDRIRDHGFVEPVVVRPLPTGKYEILSNPEAWLAAGQLELPKVPVLIRDDLDDERAAEIVQDHYVLRHRNPIEEARYFEARLERFGGPASRGAITRLAHHLKRGRPYIAHSLRLLSLPSEVQDMIAVGALSPGQARPLVALKSRSDQLRLARQIVDEKLSARSAEALARAVRSGNSQPLSTPAAAPTATKDPNVLRLEKEVSAIIGTEFTIDEGRAVINFFGDYDVLDGVLEKLGYRP